MNEIIKPDLVILEGSDKAGKSTIYQAFRRATDYQPLIIDRFIGSNIVYDQLYERKDSEEIEEYYQLENELVKVFNPLVVYLWAPISTLLNRSIQKGEIESERYDIENISWYYNEYLNDTSLDVIGIDTSIHSVEEVVKIIMNTLSYRQDKVKNQWSA